MTSTPFVQPVTEAELPTTLPGPSRGRRAARRFFAWIAPQQLVVDGEVVGNLRPILETDQLARPPRAPRYLVSALLAVVSMGLIFTGITELAGVWVAVLLLGVFVGWLAFVRQTYEDQARF